jgi:hypothetical protein
LFTVGKVPPTKWTNIENEQRNTATRIDTVSKWINGTLLDGQTIKLKSLELLLNIKAPPDEIAKLPCCMLPYSASLNFFARNDSLQQIGDIYAASADRQPVALSLYGLPGVGKTQLALKYAQLNQSNYSAVLWIAADTAIKISEAFSNAVQKLRLPRWNLRMSRSSEAATLVAWLEETGKVPPRNLSHSSLTILQKFPGCWYSITWTRLTYCENFGQLLETEIFSSPAETQQRRYVLRQMEFMSSLLVATTH